MKKIILRSLLVLVMLLATLIVYVAYLIHLSNSLSVRENEVDVVADLIRLESGHILVDVEIQGKTYPFIMDNGANTLFFESLLDSVELDPSLFTLRRDVNKNIHFPRLHFSDSLRLFNEIVVDSVYGTVEPDFFECGSKVYGIIGHDILSYFNIGIYFDDDSLRVSNKVISVENGVDLELLSSKRDYVNLSVDGQQTKCIIDLGSQFYLNYQIENDSIAENSLFYKRVIGKGTQGLSKKAALNQYLKLSKEVNLGGLKLQDVRSTVSTKMINTIGLKFLSNFDLILNYSQGKAWLKPNPQQTFTDTQFGVGFEFQDDHVFVNAVLDNTLPYELGIRPGDTIVSINNKSYTSKGSFCTFSLKEIDTLEFIKKHDHKVYKIPRAYYFEELLNE